MSESTSFEGYLINSFRQVVKEELESTRWHIEQSFAKQAKTPLMRTISMQDMTDRLGLKAVTILKLQKEGAFTGFKIAGKWRFYEHEIVKYIDRQIKIQKNESTKALEKGND